MQKIESEYVRMPAVSGTFYPSNAKSLKSQIARFLAETPHDRTDDIYALVVPHAGYIYSGSVAGSAYAQLIPYARQFKRVLILGPSHRVYLRGMAVPTCRIFQTPLGNVSVDSEGIRDVLQCPHVVQDDAPHRLEHSLEVQLPFLQMILPEFKLIPVAVGDAEPEEVANVIHAVKRDDTLVIVSSDLSHYLPHAEAKKRDAETAQSIESLSLLQDNNAACGQAPLNGLIFASNSDCLKVKVLDLRNSGDTAGSQDQVVGYGAFIFHK